MAKPANTTNPIPRKCAVEGCLSRHKAKGYCARHYEKLRYNGDPCGGRQIASGSVEKWLRKQAEYDGDECTPWPFSLKSSGYGQGRLDGKPCTAHRAICILAHGPAPFPGAQAAHRCPRNRSCTTKRHIYWATPEQNAKDKVLHGTQAYGEAGSKSKFSNATILAIASDNRRPTVVAQSHGCSISVVTSIRSGATWSWLTGIPKRYNSENPNPGRSGKPKLCDEKVREIFFAPGILKEIGAQYGVNSSTVSLIKRRKAWRHLTASL